MGSGIDSLPGFSEDRAEIGSITPAGTFHLIPLPSSPQRYPDSITAGPDGNLWFTELGSPDLHNVQAPHAYEIARLTPSGKITDFPLSPSSDSPTFILAGPDGNLWFAIGSVKGQNAHGKLGRITPKARSPSLICPRTFLMWQESPVDRMATSGSLGMGISCE